MKKTHPSDSQELRPEYRFDYTKARPNRFADKPKESRVVVVLDPDIAEVFTTPQAVNNMLRALIQAMSQNVKYEVKDK